MVKSKLTKKNKSGGYTDLYAKAVEAQSKGYTRYNELKNTDPRSDFNRCECIDYSGNAVDAFDFPKNMFTCNLSEGLKLVDNKRDPFYRTYRDLKEQAFFQKSAKFPFVVEKEFMDLISKNQKLSEAVARFVIDFTLDPKEHKGRVFIDTLIPGSMQTLLNNVQAIQQGIAMVANDPALKFNDITKLLGELITRLQDQYVKLRKLQDKHGKTLRKMDLLRKSERARNSGINMVNVKKNTNRGYSNRGYSNRGYSNRRYSNRNNRNNRRVNLEKLIEKELDYLYRDRITSKDKENMRRFNEYVIPKLQIEFSKLGIYPDEVQKRVRENADYIAIKIVELLFEKRLQITKLLNINVLTKFLRVYIRHYLRTVKKKMSRTAGKIAELYTGTFLENLGITDGVGWYNAISENVDLGSPSLMQDIADVIVDYITFQILK